MEPRNIIFSITPCEKSQKRTTEGAEKDKSAFRLVVNQIQALGQPGAAFNAEAMVIGVLGAAVRAVNIGKGACNDSGSFILAVHFFFITCGASRVSCRFRLGSR